MTRAAANHQKLDRALEEVAANIGIEQKKAPLKGRDRAVEKINDKYAGRVEKIADIARGGVSVKTAEEANQFVQALSERFLVIDEGWSATPVNYFDRKLLVRFDDGQLGEVQIWPEGMLEAKDRRGHDLYKIIRDPESTPEEVARATEESAALYGEVYGRLSDSLKAVIDLNRL